jgi:hypothetical protein
MAGTLPPKLRALMDFLRDPDALESDLLTVLRAWREHTHGSTLTPALPTTRDLVVGATHCQTCEDILARAGALDSRLRDHGAARRMQIDQVEAEVTDVMKKAHPELFLPEER